MKPSSGIFSPKPPIGVRSVIWYYEHPCPEGCKSCSKTKPMRIEEFAPEKAWWSNRVENDFARKVGIDRIRECGFNLDPSNPNGPGHAHEDPDELLVRFEKEQDAAALREQLRQAPAETQERTA